MSRTWLGGHRVAIAVAVVAALLMAPVAPASAARFHLIEEVFGSAAQPSFNAGGAAIELAEGDLLVLERTGGASNAGLIARYHPDGTPAPFSALGTNQIDGQGSGSSICSPPSPECDGTPQGGLSINGFAGNQEITVDNSCALHEPPLTALTSPSCGEFDPANGDIYLTQFEHHLIDVFDASGAYLGQLTGDASREFSGILSPCGVAVGPGGELFVAGGGDNTVYRFEQLAAPHNPLLNGDGKSLSSATTTPCNLAAGTGASAGALFAARATGGGVGTLWKLDALSGALDYTVVSTSPENPVPLVGVDPVDGHLYSYGATRSNRSGTFNGYEVREYDASGSSPPAAPLATLPFPGSKINGMAVRNGRVYLAEGDPSGNRFDATVFGQTVVVPDAVSGGHAIDTDTSVTLEGTVNPDGVPLADCHFEYGKTPAYGSIAPCEAPAAGEITGGSPVGVHAKVEGLDEEAGYHYRLVAANANAALYPKDPSGTARGADRTVETPSKPEIAGQWARGIGTREATITASINPNNAETDYRFEWGLGEVYEHSTAEIPLGTVDENAHTVSFALGELQPGTTYHFHVVAANHRAPAGIEGSDGIFTTYRAGLRPLADGRAWELVTPPLKGGAEVAVPGNVGGQHEFSVRPVQATRDGEAITFASFTSFGHGRGAGLTSQYLSRRGASGWSTANLTPTFEEGWARDPVVGFSGDLERAAEIAFNPPCAAGVPASVWNLCRYDVGPQTSMGVTSVVPRLSEGGEGEGYCVAFAGASESFDRVFFAVQGGALLSGDPLPSGSRWANLYEWTPGGGPVLASALPGGTAATPQEETSFGAGHAWGSAAGCDMEPALLRHAVSTDGRRAFWTYAGPDAAPITTPFLAEPPVLFARLEAPGGMETVELDARQGGSSPSGGGVYQDASRDGTQVFFTDAATLTPSPAKPGDLYRYDIGKREKGAANPLRDLTAHTVNSEAAEVLGVLGVSENGEYAYFAARGVLTTTPNSHGNRAVAGQPNLYVWHEGESEPRFIATLSGSAPDHFDWSENLSQQTARVSPDGRYLAFLSAMRLTGYDNTPDTGVVGCGEAGCSEVFRYDFADARLTCVSCNPTNARPAGASVVPGWSTPYEQPRYLLDDGRVLFTSHDALSPDDADGKGDVYEFEPAGIGDCTSESPAYSQSAAGCVQLISSGTGGDESYLLDASVDGRDVFISTRERLAPQESDSNFDVYDARIGGGFPYEPPVACEGAEQCHAGGVSAGAGYAAGTAAFRGAGNPGNHRCPRGGQRARRRPKARCVGGHRHHRKHRRRHRRRAGNE